MPSPAKLGTVLRLPSRPEPAEAWSFVMIWANEKHIQALLQAVADGPRGFTTLRVWNALIPHLEAGTGRVTCSQRRLAQTASVGLGDVSRALARLVELGALQKAGRGRYAVNPRFVWRGELAKREEAEKAGPRLVKAP